MNTKLKSAVEKFELLSFLDKVKRITIAGISLIALILTLFYFVTSIVDNEISIVIFPMPKGLTDLGYTEGALHIKQPASPLRILKHPL